MILFLFMLFFPLPFISPLRRYDYHFLLLWGLGHCQDMNVNFQFKNILWNIFSYFKIYLLPFPWNRVLGFLTLPLRSEVSLNNWGLKKSYNTTVFSPSTRLSLHASTPLTSAGLGWSSFFFLSLGTGEWRWGEVYGTCLCAKNELTVMKFGMWWFSNRIGSCVVFP